MKKLLPILLTSALSAMSQAAVITVFDDSAYVDTTNSSFAESDTLQASLTSFGYTFSTFTGDSAVAWNTALSGSDILLIPETEPNSAAGNNLEAAGAGSALRSFISGGGTLISFADSASGVDSISASIFGFSLTNESAPSSWAISADGIAAGYSSPSVLNLSATRSWSRASVLAEGGTSYYDNGTSSTVFSLDYGAGTVFLLGWDWFNAAPLGTRDDGWLNVLNQTVENAAVVNAVPSPAGIALLGLGLAALRSSRRIKT